MIRKLFLIFIGMLLLCGCASATVADIGNPQTIGKHAISIYSGYQYGEKFAVRYNTTSDTTIDSVGFYRYMDAEVGDGGVYSVQLRNDENGLPGSIILAENTSFVPEYPESGALWGKQQVILDSEVQIESSKKYWFVWDGSQADVNNYMDFAIIDTQIQPDGIFGIDYQRWPVARWNGTAWSTPYMRLGEYPVYGVVWVYNDGEMVGDGQFACREDTQSIYSIYTYGNKITNAPTTAYNISSVSARLAQRGTPTAELYFTVLDKNKNELANRSVTPYPANWSKTTYTFDPEIEIPAGNNEIYIFFKSPDATSTNCIQTRAIEYVDAAHSYPYSTRYVNSGTSYYEKSALDDMTNISISFGENTGTDYFVSPTVGDNNNPGSATLPWKTLVKASTSLPANSTLWLMPGTYANDTLTLTQSNMNVSAFSTGVSISMVSGQTNAIYGNGASNVTVNGINITGAGTWDTTSACCAFFQYGNNITVSNCTITDGNDGIRFRRGNDTLAQDNYISRMRYHGVHLYGQMEPAGKYSRMSVIRNNISDCGHNMIDLHSNISDCKIANNDVYFTDSWTTWNDNVSIFLHNGNIPRTIVENNSIHDGGRPLVIANANDCIIRNNTIYDGLNWGTGDSSSPTILIEGANGSIPGMTTFGCNNLTITKNDISDLGYAYTFSSEDDPTSFSNISFSENTYSNISIANFRKPTTSESTGIVFTDDIFSNFTLAFDYGANISDGDIQFRNSTLRLYDDAGDSYTVNPSYVNLAIDDDVTDVWTGTAIEAPTAAFSASPLTGTASTIITFTDSSTGEGLSYFWDFENDGDIDSTEQNPTHAYTSAGTYTVNLTASNVGGTDSEVKSSYITIEANAGTDPLTWFYWWMKSHWRW